MQPWQLMFKHTELTSFGGIGVALAVGLIIALRVLLPRADRSKLRLPVAALALHLLLVAGRALLPTGARSHALLATVASVVLLVCIGRAGFLFAVDWLLGKRLARPLSKIFRDIIQVLVYAAIVLIALRGMGFDPGSLLTTSALLTAVIGLSLQETLGNLFAGLALQAERPFEVGDWVQFDADQNLVGRVVELNWRAAKILTNDAVEIIVPNGILAKSPIRNYTQPTDTSRRIVSVQGPYEMPPHRVSQAILQAIRGTVGILDQPPPEVRLHQFADSGIEYRVLFFTNQFQDRERIEAAVRSRIWYGFQRAGISVPFPIRDMRFSEPAEVSQTAAPDLVLDMLRQVDFLQVLPDDLLTILAQRIKLVVYSSGELVIEQGDAGRDLFIVKSGEMEVSVDSGRGSETVAQLGSGKVFGEMSLMTGAPRAATVRALTDCELLVIDHSAFREVLNSSPDLAESISAILAGRRAELEQHLTPGPANAAETDARGKVLLDRIKDFFSI